MGDGLEDRMVWNSFVPLQELLYSTLNPSYYELVLETKDCGPSTAVGPCLHGYVDPWADR